MSEANTEKARLNKLQDDQKEELASCQKKLQEELEVVSQLKEKLKQQEDCYNMKLTQEVNLTRLCVDNIDHRWALWSGG